MSLVLGSESLNTLNGPVITNEGNAELNNAVRLLVEVYSILGNVCEGGGFIEILNDLFEESDIFI